MHICLNMTGGTQWMGGVIYIQNLVHAINSFASNREKCIKLSLAVSSSQKELVDSVSKWVDHVYEKESIYIKICKNLPQYSSITEKLLNPYEIDFFYPTIANPRASFKWGAWIPDFQAYYLPEFFSLNEIENCKRCHKKIAKNAPILILSSKAAEEDFKRFYPASKARTRVLQFATTVPVEWFEPNPLEIQKKYNLPNRFFLVSNQFWKHKDHGIILDALYLLKQQGKDFTVACTGNTQDARNPEYFSKLVQKVERLDLKEQFRILGLIPRLDQIQLMRQCLAVIQPSRFEGWSTVVEDAKALGKSLLLTKLSVHVEQAPPDSYFFELSSYTQLAELMLKADANLEAGFNPEREAIAREKSAQRVQAFGEEFINIAHEAIYGS
ncbi:glycosyltransferase family 1 protein [Thermoleptolyngbya sp. C42_A2020_037]|uniref:glycosyltransferase family 4 protein n=1 Tax=Thermoleptolyngbya sp. C42_A2020_037 TaxID=2747799 RepID=UPI0025F0CE99|nr:glycosyltransferase family 1 protein [Thermoleptolyngbya sp. C42_A2020_037]